MKRWRLIKARKDRGWTQAQVAQKLGVTPSFYGMIEQGARNPRLPMALKMESLFELPAAELFPDLFCAQKANVALGDDGQTAALDTGTEG